MLIHTDAVATSADGRLLTLTSSVAFGVVDLVLVELVSTEALCDGEAHGTEVGVGIVYK